MFLLKTNILLLVGFDNDCITNSFSMSDFLARKKLQNNQNFWLRNKKCTLKIAHMKKEWNIHLSMVSNGIFPVRNCRLICEKKLCLIIFNYYYRINQTHTHTHTQRPHSLQEILVIFLLFQLISSPTIKQRKVVIW